MASPQVENGYMKIANEIMDRLISYGLTGFELAIVLHILRKTYGYNKLEDEISISQFSRAIPRCSIRTICSSLKRLQLLKLITLVKKGNSKKTSNLWSFNKDYDTWTTEVDCTNSTTEVDCTSNDSTTAIQRNQLLKPASYTKDNIQKTTITNVIEATPKKKSVKSSYGDENINWVISEFKSVMGFDSAGGQKDRFMAKHLLNHFSREEITSMLKYCSTDPFAPRVGSVEKLWYKRGDIESVFKKVIKPMSKRQEGMELAKQLGDPEQAMFDMVAKYGSPEAAEILENKDIYQL